MMEGDFPDEVVKKALYFHLALWDHFLWEKPPDIY